VGDQLANGHPTKCREMPPCYAGSYSQVQLCASPWHAMGNLSTEGVKAVDWRYNQSDKCLI